jgi:hypothetical protein
MFESIMGLLILVIMATMISISIKSTIKDDFDDKSR